jgi:hypothetical protein
MLGGIPGLGAFDAPGAAANVQPEKLNEPSEDLLDSDRLSHHDNG